MAGWNFPPNSNGGQLEGFNQAAVDIWQGTPIYSVVRESIQNSLDARSGENPSVVSFSFHEIVTPTEISSLASWFDVGKKASGELENEAHHAKEFYTTAIEVTSGNRIPILAIQDYNTCGLTGPKVRTKITDKGRWLSLVHSTGNTHQESGNAGGSYGHGSKAPFAMTQLRTIFYLTQIEDAQSTELRFQGKSILQTMASPDDDGIFTQATGFLCNDEGRNQLMPLLNHEVPDWATEIRKNFGAGTGTSVFVPAPRLSEIDQTFEEIRLIVLANFYASIASGKLEVRVNSESISAENVEQVFDDYLRRFEKQDEFNFQLVKELDEGIQAALCMRNPDHEGHFELENFGEVKWYFRSNPGSSKRRIGISREKGMLITSKAPNLNRIKNAKPFEMFVMVMGEEGNKLLRQLENPEHTKFDFDRITQKAKKDEAKNRYKKFSDELKNVYLDLASLDLDHQIFVDDLDDLFGAGVDSNNEPGRERLSPRIKIGKQTKIKPPVGRPESGVDDGDFETPAGGVIGGDGGEVDPGGNLPRQDGKDKSKGGSRQKSRDIKNLRITAQPRSNVATVHYTPLQPGNHNLILSKAGVEMSEDIQVKQPGESTWKSKIYVDASRFGARVSIAIEFQDGDLKFGLEGRTEDA